mgnify:CR=1 FL=1|jgi:hypothetical protein
MKLITENIEEIKYLTETTESGKKSLYIQGPFLVGERANRNRRLYKMDTLREEVKRYTDEYISANRALGELGHPDTPNLNLERVCIKIESLKEDSENRFIGKAKVLDTPYGNIVKNFIDSGVSLGVSSRGMGSLIPGEDGISIVADDFRLATAADVVADPSAPGAFVNGIMENKEWLFVEGRFVEVDIERTKQAIQKASRKDIEKVAFRLFENFLSKL